MVELEGSICSTGRKVTVPRLSQCRIFGLDPCLGVESELGDFGNQIVGVGLSDAAGKVVLGVVAARAAS